MTLGEFIKELDLHSPDKHVRFQGWNLYPTSFDSYRGYYERLALGFSTYAFAKDVNLTVAKLLAEARECVGKTFEGYKGGDFTMGENTLLHAANYGDTGRKIVALSSNGYEVLIVTEENDS